MRRVPRVFSCHLARGTLAVPLAVGMLGVPLTAQAPGDERASVLATAEAALAAVTAEDMIAFTDLMLEEATTLGVGEREGDVGYRVRSRAEARAQTLEADIVERGFDPEVRISGPLAVVWLPYDLYIDGEWSHCGVDTFTFVRTGEGWRIASMAWTIEQPPACRRHPEGPPGG